MRKLILITAFAMIAMATSIAFCLDQATPLENQPVTEIREVKNLLKNNFDLRLSFEVRLERYKWHAQNVKDIQADIDSVAGELDSKNDEKARLKMQIEASTTDPDAIKDFKQSLLVVERQMERLAEKQNALENRKRQEDSLVAAASAQLETAENEIAMYLQKNK